MDKVYSRTEQDAYLEVKEFIAMRWEEFGDETRQCAVTHLHRLRK